MYRDAPAGPSPILYASFGKYVVALERNSGKRLWEHRLPLGRTPRIAVQTGRVYVLESDLWCLEAEKGTVIWRTPGATGGTLLVDGDCIFIGSAGTVACYATIDGRHLWEDHFTGYGVATVALAVPGAAVQAESG